MMHSGHKMYFSLSARRRSLMLGARDRLRRTRTGGIFVALAAAAIFLVTCGGGYAAADDLFDAVPVNASNLLADVQPAEPAEPTPSVLSELKDNLHLSGYIQSNYGLFYNTEGTKWWPHHDLNSIESLRQLGQLDLNESFGDHLQFFARFWGVYEPNYPFENGAKMGSGNLSDFYNEYDFRDLWLKVSEGPLNVFIGKQIVEWGESLAFRVGDQINPQDVSYAFGFNNLEASHLPIYMLHPILNLPAAGYFGSNFLEMVYAPGFDDMWNHVDYPDDRFDGQDAVAGRNRPRPQGRICRRRQRSPQRRTSPGLRQPDRHDPQPSAVVGKIRRRTEGHLFGPGSDHAADQRRSGGAGDQPRTGAVGGQAACQSGSL